MAQEGCNKGGLGHRDAMDYVEQLRLGGTGVVAIRAELAARGYKKSRISQLCPLSSANPAAASEPCAPPAASQPAASVPDAPNSPEADNEDSAFAELIARAEPEPASEAHDVHVASRMS